MQAEKVGEWRKPVNTAAHQKGGIHDDDTATELGFRGGTVAGAIHMEHQILRAFDPAERALIEAVRPPFVGLYGAIEIEFLNGPVLSSTEYMASGQIVGLSDSPQTEILWRDMVLGTNQPVARMLKMDRLMKNSSPLWA